VSHEEPDIEVPERAKLEPALKQTGARVPAEPQDLRGEITWQVIVSGVIVAAIMGTAYPYMVLKLGFGPNVSVVAAFFGFLFLKVIDLVLRQRSYDRWQNNLAEAAGTSAAQTAFMCVLLGAFDLLREQTKHSDAPFQMDLPWHTSFIWLTTAATLGVLMAVPLRRHFVVDEQLPYVDGLSTAETITVLDPPRSASPAVRRAALNAFWAVMIGVTLSGLLMAFREDALFVTWIPGAWKPDWQIIGDTVVGPTGAAVVTGVVLAKMSVGVQWSLLSVGSGMLIGLRINVSMIIGSTLAWVVAPYFLVEHGMLHDPNGVVITTPSKTDVLFWVMWPATGMLVAGGLTALALRWRLLVDTFRSLRSAKIDGAEFPLSIIVPGIAISAIALCVVQQELLGMPIWMTVAAILLSVPLMLVGLRVLGETNWGPISALSNMMQGLFAAVAPGNIAANMVASGTAGTVATSSEMIMQDYKCGHIIGTKPRLVTVMQLIAIPIGALAVSLIYPVLVRTFRIVETVDAAGNKIPPGLDSPISQKWSGFAQILREGPGALPDSALYMLAIFTVLGVIFTVLESNKKIKQWVPSPTGIGIGILVSFLVVFTMFLGGVIGAIWAKLDKKSADTYMIPLGSGFIAGEALVAVIAAIYFGVKGG
jgi:uncharacterized oligopeptide transporter (OPT) family protein